MQLVFDAFKNIDYVVTFFIIIYSLLSDIFMALRWTLLSQNKCKFIPSLESYFLVSLLNVILPGRIGELSRFFYLKKFFNISYNFNIAVFTLDRGLDIIILAIATILGVELFFTSQLSLSIPIAIIFLSLLFFYMVKYKRQKLMRILTFLPHKFIRIYLKKIVKNIHSILKIKILIDATIYTLLVWVVNATFFIAFLKYVANFDLTLTQCFVVYLASAIGKAIPITPAGIGTFHMGVIYILTMYGIDKESAIAASVLLHIMQILPSIIGGVIVISNKKISFKELQNANQR